jgi:hypothetical protein
VFLGEGNQFTFAYALFGFQVMVNGIQIVIRPSRISIAVTADLFDNFIFPHCHASNNSFGVQITGGSYPCARQIMVMVFRTIALARWRMFHVNQ